MATELLSVLGNPKAMPVIHRVDHDLESAFYSLAHEVSVMVRDGVVAVCKNTHETSETLYKAFGWDHTEPDAVIALRDLMLTVTNRRSPLVRLRNSIHQDALSAVLCEAASIIFALSNSPWPEHILHPQRAIEGSIEFDVYGHWNTSLTLIHFSPFLQIHYNGPSLFGGISNRAIGHVIAFLRPCMCNRLHRDSVYRICIPAHNAYRDAANLRCEYIHHPSDYAKVHDKYSKQEWLVVELHSTPYPTCTILFMALPQTSDADCIPYPVTLSTQGQTGRVAKLVKNKLPVLPPMVTRAQVPLAACHAMSIYASKDYKFPKIVIHLDQLDSPFHICSIWQESGALNLEAMTDVEVMMNIGKYLESNK